MLHCGVVQFLGNVPPLLLLNGQKAVGKSFGPLLQSLAHGNVGDYADKAWQLAWRGLLEPSINLQPAPCPVLAFDAAGRSPVALAPHCFV